MLPTALLSGLFLAVSAQDWGADTVREAGRCVMYDTCGRKGGIFGQELPCADNSKAREVDSSLRSSLMDLCGSTSAWDHACCTPSQLDVLSQSLSQAEPLLALCPACRLNFRDFYCSMTCSPDQSLFVSVTSIQNLSSSALTLPTGSGATNQLDAFASGPAVQSLAFHVDPSFGSGFFDSCKNVKFGATNGYAMDLIGGGAKNWTSFVKYMGTERPGLGSPFQIDFPQPPNLLPVPSAQPRKDDSVQAFNHAPQSCSSSDPTVKCACADCPANCLELPSTQSPDEQRRNQCRVGKLRCFDFALILLYSISLVLFFFGLGLNSLWQQRSVILPKLRNRASHLSGIALEDDPVEGTEDHQSSHSSNSAPASRAARADSSMMGSSPAGSLSRQRLGRGASLADPLEAYQPRTYIINTYLSKWFYNLGFFCASKPYITIALGLLVCGLLNAGWARFSVEKDPVKLWVAAGSDSALNKHTFEKHFGPFYRTEQVILSSVTPETEALTYQRIAWWANVEKDIRELRSPLGYTLQDVCFAPAGHAESPSDCVVQSFMGYFGDDIDAVEEDRWRDQLDECATSPSLCLPGSGLPLSPRILFGGIPGYSGNHSSSVVDSGEDSSFNVAAHTARAAVVTYVVNNSLNKSIIAKAENWEATLQNYLQALAERAPREAGLNIAYSTGISLEQELNKSTNTDVPIVVLSYLVMFFYISLSLGGTTGSLLAILQNLFLKATDAITNRVKNIGPIHLDDDRTRRPSTRYLLQRMLVESKFLLGLWGIAIVLLSVSTAVGLFSLFGIKITLIIAEVIPFLVLAIGVDNVFLLAHELERQNAHAYSSMPRFGGQSRMLVDEELRREEYDEDLDGLPSPEERVAKALARMGPSITLSAVCETVAFSLGALVGMPAVRNFAIYAAGAVAINALLQVTVFISAMTLDLRRAEANRIDCLPVLKVPSPVAQTYQAKTSWVAQFIQNYYAPFLLRDYVKRAVLVVFSLLFVLAWMSARSVDLGLDQRLALPSSSYLVDYFDAIDDYLDVGPPVYFVTQNLNVTSRRGQQSICGRFSACQDYSLANVLEAERKQSKSSFLAEPPASWIDDFFQFLNPALETCCRVKKRDHAAFCSPEDSELACLPCFEVEQEQWNISMEGFPQGDSFMRYLEQWLITPTDENCPLGGQAAYSSALSLDSAHEVSASHFRTYHTPLKTQNDYIDALTAADRISADLTNRVDGRVFPYSIFYVFFDQYISIVSTTRQVLLLALLAVTVSSSLLLGSLRTGGVVGATSFMSTLFVMGFMGIWDVSLNAISLVNLVISVGISVEFCSHIARAFMTALGGGLPHKHPSGLKERHERAWTALADVGPSVFSGITLTKLVGISVLALTKSKLLRTYYFRMWLGLIISGALCGLVFLPVALVYQGGRGYNAVEDESFLIDYNEPLFASSSDHSDEDE